MHEIDETRSAGRDEAFEMIIERIKSAGGEIVQDEITPLYVDMGAEEIETGTQRIVQFALKTLDFKLTRNVEKFSIQGEGKHKHLVELSLPRIKITLRRKPASSSDWQIVDFEDML